MTKNFEGHNNRECGEHRTVGSHRAWCHDCTEWCYPEIPCRGCKIPQLELALTEANQFLEQTIEVLGCVPYNFAPEAISHWHQLHAKPLLDNLKAREKEPDAHQQAVKEILAPKPIDHVDGGFKP